MSTFTSTSVPTSPTTCARFQIGSANVKYINPMHFNHPITSQTLEAALEIKAIKSREDHARRALIWHGHVRFLQGRSEFDNLLREVAMHSERPANLNSDLPACIRQDLVPKVTPSIQVGHEPSRQSSF